MKKIIIAMAAIAAALSMTSCNKEQLVEPEKNTASTEGNSIITASTEDSLTKTALQGNDTDGYEVVWSDGDSFKIEDETFTLIQGAGTTSGKFQGNLPNYNGWFTAYYPASYDGSNWPTEQIYTENGITGSPMVAGFSIYNFGKIVGETVKFTNVGGILRLSLKGTAQIRSIKIKAEGLNEITLNCGNGVKLDPEVGKAFHIAMPEGEYEGVSIFLNTTNFDYCTKKLKAGTKLKIERSKITTASFTASFPSPTSTDPLSGTFSIGDTKRIRFSKGNLWYGKVGEAQTATFQFEAKQYNFHGYASHTWGLFGWPTSATNYGMSLQTAADKYSGAFVDWGKAFDNEGTWRTLTKDEWTYLFETRPNAGNKYGYGRIANVYGLIILPDEFTDPMKNNGSGAFKPQSSTASGWNDNYYILGGNWEAMEVAGAVFLPAAGRRNGDSINYTSPTFYSSEGMIGFYWSSPESGSDNAYSVEFSGSSVKPAVASNRNFGLAVRLVSDLYTVTFDLNGKEGTTPESIIGIKRGSTITKPSVPAVNDYRVSGWYKDAACTQAWNFDSDVVSSNITLYADWTKFGEGYGEVKAEAGIPGNKVKWIQLWDSGPKFAEFNVGAKSITEYGGYYQWGGSEDNGSDCYTGYDFLKGDTDTAYKLWGSNWRMPSKDEFEGLMWTYCDIVWTDSYNDSGIKGLIFTGKGDYSIFSIFLPAGFSISSNDNGNYWTNMPGSYRYAYHMNFNDMSWGFGNYYRDYNYNVRAVYVGE